MEEGEIIPEGSLFKTREGIFAVGKRDKNLNEKGYRPSYNSAYANKDESYFKKIQITKEGKNIFINGKKGKEINKADLNKFLNPELTEFIEACKKVGVEEAIKTYNFHKKR